MKTQYVFYLILILFAVFFVFFGPLQADSDVEGAKEALQDGAILIDVRTKAEYDDGHAKEAINIPYDEIARHLHEIDAYKEKGVVVYCRSGRRSGIAKQTLLSNGFGKVINAGGLKDMASVSCFNC